MEDCATGYAAYILEQVEAAKQTCADPVVLIEQRVDFTRWVEQGFGTVDCIVIADGTLRICDYKHGLGILVSAEDNPQMKCYALGALVLFDGIYDIDTVSMTIYQPRRQNVSTCELSKDELYRWAEEVLKPTAALAFAGDGNYLCGEWCGFCKAKHECRARAEANLSLAQHDFKLPPLLEDTEIEVILSRVDELVAWASDIKEYALRQAVIIKRIYGMFLQGQTYHGIAKQLTEDGIPTPGGKKDWSISTVKSILSNEKYKGDALLQKSYTFDFLTKKTKVNEGEIPQYYVEDNYEAIIDPATFDMVQREMQRRGYGKNRHSGVHLFSGKIKCGQCGSWYGSKVWHSNSKYRKTIWQCNHKFNNDEHCQTPHLTDEDIQNCFFSATNKLLATKDSVVTDAQTVLSMFLDTAALEQEQDELLEETQVVSDMVQQCIYDNAHVALDQTEYKKRFDSLSQRFEKAKSRLDTVMEEPSPAC